MIDIGDVKWKTPSSKTLSLRYKLEEAKKYLRQLKLNRCDLFDNYSMNGDLNITGQLMLKSFYKIAFANGFTHLKVINLCDQTNEFLKEDLSYLTNEEIDMLKN